MVAVRTGIVSGVDVGALDEQRDDVGDFVEPRGHVQTGLTLRVQLASTPCGPTTDHARPRALPHCRR